MQAPIAHDPSSYANISAFVTTHLVLDLTTDFGARVMSGQVSLSFERRDPSATELVLDTRDLTISKTEAAIGSAAWVETPFKLDAPTPAFGSALRIVMPPGADRARVTYVDVAGRQGPAVADAGADGGPEASVPVQPGAGDPGAVVHSVAGHAGRAHDVRRHDPHAEGARGRDGRGTEERGRAASFQFTMPQPIPSYLIALAVGDLAYRAMDSRTGVWAEPSTVDAAAREFERYRKDDRGHGAPVRPLPLGPATTCSCCRRRFRSAAWRIRG